MTKYLSPNALDASLDYIAARADLMTLCAGAPDTVADAIGLAGAGGSALASIALSEGPAGPAFSVGEASSPGRRVAVATQSAVPVAVDGTADHVALIDTANGELLVVTEMASPQSVTAGQILSVKAFGNEILLPI